MLRVSGIVQCSSFCDWFISVSITSSGFIYVLAGATISSFRLNNIPSCGDATFCLTVCLWTLWFCLHFGYVNNTAVNMVYKFLFDTLLLTLRDISPKAELLDFVGIPFLIFEEPPVVHQAPVCPYPRRYSLLSVSGFR